MQLEIPCIDPIIELSYDNIELSMDNSMDPISISNMTANYEAIILPQITTLFIFTICYSIYSV